MSKEMRKYIDTFKERLTESENLNISDVSRSQICINIPKGIKSHMDKLGIPENNQSQLFKEYIDFLLGVNYGMEDDGFMSWTQEEDNYIDFMEI